MKITNILVTGSDGYIGNELVYQLKKKKFRVVGLDTEYYKKCYLGPKREKVRVIRKDVRRVGVGDLKNIDAIIHLAALSNDPLGAINPHLTDDINHKASVRLARLAKKAGVKRFIFSSSCSIYGIANGEVNEKSTVHPLTAYAHSKIDTENELKQLADDSFCVCLMRNSTVYGFSPKFRYDLVVNNMVANAVVNGEIRIMSDGTPWRPLIDVRDLSAIFTLFLRAPAEKVNGEVFNIGFYENNIQVKSIVREIKRQLPDCKIVYTGEHGKDTRSYKVNFNKFHVLFPKLKQQWPMSKSIRDLISRIRKYKTTSAILKRGVYTRITLLEALTREKKVNNNLFWK